MGWLIFGYLALWPLVGGILVVGTVDGWNDKKLGPLKGSKNIFVIILSVSLFPAAVVLLYQAVPELAGIWEPIPTPDGMRTTNLNFSLLLFMLNLWPVAVIGYAIWAAGVGVWGLRAVNAGEEKALFPRVSNPSWRSGSSPRNEAIQTLHEAIQTLLHRWDVHPDKFLPDADDYTERKPLLTPDPLYEREEYRRQLLFEVERLAVSSREVDHLKEWQLMLEGVQRNHPDWKENLGVLRSLNRHTKDILATHRSEDLQRQMKRFNQLVGSASIDEQKQLKDLMREAERKDPQWTKNLKLLRSLVRDMEEEGPSATQDAYAPPPDWERRLSIGILGLVLLLLTVAILSLRAE